LFYNSAIKNEINYKFGLGNVNMSENNKLINLSDDDTVYMDTMQLEYFKSKLIDWKHDILEKSKNTLEELQQVSLHMADLNDRASSETDHAIELRTRDRQRKLISKIDSALERIRDGSYGYCEETGEKIGIKRLEARPIATLSLEAQEFHERREKVYRDED
jgi:DnaK suppressor protein